MSFIENIRKNVGEHMLRKEVASIVRRRDLFNLKTSLTAGIVYEASSVEDYELIKKYVGYLKEYGIKVKTIGYFSKKEIPQFTFSKLDYEFFTKKELNLWLEYHKQKLLQK